MFKGRTFSFTADLTRSRDSLKEEVYKRGGSVRGAVTVEVDVLVMGDKGNATKLSRAQDLGIEVWTEEQFEAELAAHAIGSDTPDLLKVPSTREEALAYIELLCKQFDIVHDEDMYTAAIESMTAMYEERTAEIVKQAMGVAMKAAKRKYLVVDPSVLSDSQPFIVTTTDLPNGTCRYQLQGMKP